MYNYIHVQLYTFITIYVYNYIHLLLYKCTTIYMYYYINVQLYTCTTIYMYNYIHVQLYTRTSDLPTARRTLYPLGHPAATTVLQYICICICIYRIDNKNLFNQLSAVVC